MLRRSINTTRKLKYLAKYELRKQLAETLTFSKLDYADLVAAIHHNSYCDFCNEFNLLPQLLFSVTMLRTVGMYLKSDGFQLMREEISTP